MLLQCCEMIKRIDTGQVGGVNQAHEQISNTRTIFSFIKQSYFLIVERQDDTGGKNPFALFGFIFSLRDNYPGKVTANALDGIFLK